MNSHIPAAVLLANGLNQHASELNARGIEHRAAISNDMPFDYYRLPSGEVVPVDATASKGARAIGFTEKSGRIVTAVLVRSVEVSE